jgi:hypothetical protein
LGRGSDFYRLGVLGSTLDGLFIPAARETVEMLYEFEKPFTVKADKFISAFGDIATSHYQAIKETIAWYQKFLRETTTTMPDQDRNDG